MWARTGLLDNKKSNLIQLAAAKIQAALLLVKLVDRLCQLVRADEKETVYKLALLMLHNRHVVFKTIT